MYKQVCKNPHSTTCISSRRGNVNLLGQTDPMILYNVEGRETNERGGRRKRERERRIIFPTSGNV